MTRAVPAARLHLRSLYDCTSLHRPLSRLNRTALHDLTFCSQLTSTHPDNGVRFFSLPSPRCCTRMLLVAWAGVGSCRQRMCNASCAAHVPRCRTQMPASSTRRPVSLAQLSCTETAAHVPDTGIQILWIFTSRGRSYVPSTAPSGFEAPISAGLACSSFATTWPCAVFSNTAPRAQLY
jgi:hypothetical protein